MATRGIDRGVLSDAAAHERFLRYQRFRWFTLAAVTSLVSLLVYLLVDVQPRHNGGSWLG